MPKQDVETIKQAAAGRWPEILSSLGGVDRGILDGKHHPCPKCGGTDRFRFDVDKEFAICNKCFASANGDGIAALQWLLGSDFQATATKLAEHLGVKPLKGKGDDKNPSKDLEWKPWSSQLVAFYVAKKAGIKEEAILSAGGRMARYKRSATVIAFPIIGESMDTENPVGWVLVNATGGTLPRYDRQGNVVGQIKTKVTYGSKPGLIGLEAIEKLKTKGLVDLAWKCEGISDSLAVASIIDDERHVAVTNANGAGEKPRWMAGVLASTTCHVLHDADEAGQAGAKTWCQGIAANGGTVRHVELPYDLASDHGKDVRDWLSDGCDYADLQAMARAATETVVAKTADGEIDHSQTDFPAQELILKKLQIEVLYEDERNRVRVFSLLLRKSSWIPSVEKLKEEMMIQICGAPAMAHISSDPDGENTWKLSDIRKAIAIMASRRRGKDDERGIGIWQGLDDNGNETDTVVLAGNTEGARWNGDCQFRRILAPRADGLVLDFGAGNEEWFDADTVERHIESAQDVEWSKGVVGQAQELFARWRWTNQTNGPLLVTGLILATWTQTMWEWRPLVAVTGESNSGKSFLFEALGGSVGRRGIFGGLAFRQSKSTEAGVRQGLGNTARVALCDEFEQSKDRDKILELLRASTRGEAVARGTTDQKGRQTTLRHIGWIAAIETGLQRQPDLNRFIQLELLPAKKGKMGKLRLPEGEILSSLGQKLLAIAVLSAIRAKRMAVHLKSVEVEGVDARTVESYAVPTAAMACAVGYDETQARGLLESLLSSVDRDEQGQSDSDDLLADIMTAQIFCGGKDGHLTVSQILDSESFYYDFSPRLEAAGIRRMENDRVFLATRQVKRHLLQNTSWERQQIKQILIRVPGAEKSSQRIAGKVLRGVIVKIE